MQSTHTFYKKQTGDEPQKQDTQANKRSPLLSEEVAYQITLIGLSQGRLDRRRREKVIWEMFTENDSYTVVVVHVCGLGRSRCNTTY